MEGELSSLELEGRLAAHRQTMAWILSQVVVTNKDLEALKDHLDEDVPPPDHQEDPGAVPTLGHAVLTAAGIETRLLIEELERQVSRSETGPID